MNFRTHPPDQQRALTAVLNRIGVVAPVIVNKRTGRLVDGHLRLELAKANGVPTLEAVFVDLSEEEEREALATLDATSAMAEVDGEVLARLVEGINFEEPELQALLHGLSRQGGIAEAPTEFPKIDERIGTNHECPSCGFKWSR